MKNYKQKLSRVLDNVVCDICGKVCTNDFYLPESATLEAFWGYGSKHDGLRYEIDLCESCFYDTTQWMINKRKEYQDDKESIPAVFRGKDYPG